MWVIRLLFGITDEMTEGISHQLASSIGHHVEKANE